MRARLIDPPDRTRVTSGPSLVADAPDRRMAQDLRGVANDGGRSFHSAGRAGLDQDLGRQEPNPSAMIGEQSRRRRMGSVWARTARGQTFGVGRDFVFRCAMQVFRGEEFPGSLYVTK